MRLNNWLLREEVTTKSVGNLGPDSVTSNKLIRVKLSDKKIKNIIKHLKDRKNVEVTIENDGTATIDMPYHVPRDVMNKLSNYII